MHTTTTKSKQELWTGFFSAHLLLAPVILTVLFFLVGSYYYPKWIGLGLVLPYYTYILVVDRSDSKLGSPWESFRKDFVLLRQAREFLNLRLIGNAALERHEAQHKEKAQYILGVFPHGLNADFRIMADGLLSEVLPQSASRVRTLSATILFWIPIVREFALWTGCVDASKPVAKRCLRHGLSLYIFPGGQQEQLRTAHGKELAYVQRRKGFCKLALEFGVPLVPVYVFGANDLYYTSQWALSARLMLVKYLGISLTFGHGLWKSPYCPLPVNVTMVFGEPIPVTKVEHPTNEQVEKLHEQFVNTLQKLFDQHKKALGFGDRKLEIM